VSPSEAVPSPRHLLARPDFRRVYFAGAIGQLGDAFQFVAVLWYAVVLTHAVTADRHRGIAPLYAFVEPSVMFFLGGAAVFVCALVAAALVDLATRRYRAAAAAV